jgi:hypothetical protein
VIFLVIRPDFAGYCSCDFSSHCLGSIGWMLYTRTMSYDALPDAPLAEQPRPYLWLERLLLLAFAFCLLVGLLAFAIWWTLRSPLPAPLGGDPLAALRTDLVLPQLALRELGGDVADGLAVQAIQAGELETARAILTYDTGMKAAARSARLAQLGRSYEEAGDPAAAQLYVLAAPNAVLDLSTPPLERAQSLVQIAQGLLAAGQKPAALDAAAQAQRITTQTPNLLPAQRSEVLADLQELADDLADAPGGGAFAARVDDLARNPYLSPTGTQIPHRLSTFAQQVPYDVNLQAATAARQQTAVILADRIALTGGVDIDPERQALVQALLTEDQLRAAFYQQAREGDVSLPQQVWLLQDQLAWRALKLRIGRQGFGMALLPQWEQQADALLAELGAAYNDYAAALDAQAAALPTPADQALQRVENQMWLAQAVARGLYTTISPADLGERLRIVQDDAARQAGALALPIAYDPQAAPPGFRIQPKE